MATSASVSFTIDASGAKTGANEIASAIAKIQTSLTGLEAKAKAAQTGINTAFRFQNVSQAVSQIKSLEAALNSIRVPPGLGQLSTMMKTASTEIAALTASIRTLTGAMTQANATGFVTGMQNATKATQSLNSSVSSVVPLLKGLAAAFTIQGLTEFGKGVYTATQRFQSFSQTLKAVTEGPEEFNQEMKIISGTVYRLGLDIQTTQDSFAKFFASAKLSGEPVENINKIFIDLSESMTVFGLSVAKQQYVWIALEQMFNKGTIQMEELKRQLGNELPAAFEIMAKATGKSTAELAKTMKAGQLTSAEVVKFAEAYKEAFSKGLPDALAQARVGVGQLNYAWSAFLVNIGNSGAMKTLGESLRALSKEIIQFEEDGVTPLMKDGIPQLTAKFQKMAETVGSAMKTLFEGLKIGFDFLLDHSKIISTAIELYIGVKAVKGVMALAGAFDALVKSVIAYKGAQTGLAAAGIVGGAAAAGAAGAGAGAAGGAAASGVTATVAATAGAGAAATGITALTLSLKNFVGGSVGIGAGLWAIAKAAAGVLIPFAKFGIIVSAIGGAISALTSFITTSGTFTEKLRAAAGAYLDFVYEIPLLGDALHKVIHDWMGVKTVTEEAAEAQDKADPSELTTAYDRLSESQKRVVDEARAAGQAFRISDDGIVTVTKSVTDASNALDKQRNKWDAIRDATAEAMRALANSKNSMADLDSIRFDKSKAAIEDIGTLLKNKLTADVQATVAAGHQISKGQADNIDQMNSAVDSWARNLVERLSGAKGSSEETRKILDEAFGSAKKFAEAVGPGISGSLTDLGKNLQTVQAPLDAFFKALSPERFNDLEASMSGLEKPIGEVSSFLKKIEDIKLQTTTDSVKTFGETLDKSIGTKSVEAIGKASEGLTDLNAIDLSSGLQEVNSWSGGVTSDLANVKNAAEATLRALTDLVNMQSRAASVPQALPSSAELPARAMGGPVNPGMVLVGEQGPEIIVTDKPGYVLNNHQTENILKRAKGGYMEAGKPTMVGEAGREGIIASTGCAGGDCGCADCGPVKKRATGGSVMAGYPTMVGENGTEAFIPGGQYSYVRSGYQAGSDTNASSGSGKNDMAIMPSAAPYDIDASERDIWHYATAYKREILDTAVRLHQVTADQSTLVMSTFRAVADDWKKYKLNGPAGQAGIARNTNGIYPYFGNVRKLEGMYGYLGAFIAGAFGQGLAGDIENPYGTGVKSATQAHRQATASASSASGSSGGTIIGPGGRKLTAQEVAMASMPGRGSASLRTGNTGMSNAGQAEYDAFADDWAATSERNRQKNFACEQARLEYAHNIYIQNMEDTASSLNFGRRVNGLPEQTYWYPDGAGVKYTTGGGAGGYISPPICAPDEPMPRNQTQTSMGGFATGGEFTVAGGHGGIDSTLVQFMANRGERVKISQASHVKHGNVDDDENGSSGRSGPPIQINIHGVSDFNSFRRSEKQMMNRLNKALHRAQKGT